SCMPGPQPRKEWRLIGEAQRLLYHDVMLENFTLVASLGKALTPVLSVCLNSWTAGTSLSILTILTTHLSFLSLSTCIF
uniref:KRAB domain-containing protein n=1 Tax=Capra hircus TaxID=9925 RepID=A0A8C2QXN7_CAPHI